MEKNVNKTAEIRYQTLVYGEHIDPRYIAVFFQLFPRRAFVVALSILAVAARIITRL